MLVVSHTDQTGGQYSTATPLQKVAIHFGETTTITIGGSN